MGMEMSSEREREIEGNKNKSSTVDGWIHDVARCVCARRREAGYGKYFPFKFPSTVKKRFLQAASGRCEESAQEKAPLEQR